MLPDWLRDRVMVLAVWLNDMEYDHSASFTRFKARIAVEGRIVAEGTTGWSNLMLLMMFGSDHDHLREHSGGAELSITRRRCQATAINHR